MLLVVSVEEETEPVATEEAGVVVGSFLNLGLFAGVANSSVKLETEQALLGETPMVSIISEGFKHE